MAPVELIRFARIKDQRHERCRRGFVLVPVPGRRISPDGVIAALVAETAQLLEYPDKRQALTLRLTRVLFEETIQQLLVEQLTADVEVGHIYEGKVAKLMDFGAFVTILPGKDGLVHISQISDERVEKVSDKLSEGDTIKVKVLEVDKQGRIRLSMKAVGA